MPAQGDLPEIREQLLRWFRRFQRDLPWRRDQDPYRIWVSEIMLQQTRVAAVIPFYERFLENFPDIQALAAAPQQEVLRLWSGLGYYSRARNLQHAAQQVVANHSGEFPRERQAALALPGIGNYTAAAILSIAFGGFHAVLDGNVARVLARLDGVRGDLREGTRWQALQNSADQLLDRTSPSDWNQAVMELGAMVCTPRAPQCLLCPLAKFCRARELGLTGAIPEKRRKRATVNITLAAAVLVDSRGRTLLLPPPRSAPTQPGRNRSTATRATQKHATHKDVAPLLSKMWHFPTILVEKNAAEELRAFLARIGAGSPSKLTLRLETLAKARHAVTYRAIELLPYRVRVAKLPRIAGTKTVLLANLASRTSLPVSNLTRKFALAAIER
jgi:A/G-specific adenine glycosylase